VGEEHLFSVFSFFIALFVFGPVWQIKPAIRRLLGAQQP